MQTATCLLQSTSFKFCYLNLNVCTRVDGMLGLICKRFPCAYWMVKLCVLRADRNRRVKKGLWSIIADAWRYLLGNESADDIYSVWSKQHLRNFVLYFLLISLGLVDFFYWQFWQKIIEEVTCCMWYSNTCNRHMVKKVCGICSYSQQPLRKHVVDGRRGN